MSPGPRVARPLPAPLGAAALAARVGGALHGADRAVLAVAPAEAAGPDHLACWERGPRGDAGVWIARAPLPGATTVVVPDPLPAFAAVLAWAFPEPAFLGAVHPDARVHPSAVLAPGVVVGADCEVGEGTVLFPNVVLYPRTRLGARCRVHAGSVLGADGFRYHPTPRGALKVPQVGGVWVGDDVELGALCTVDRGFLGDTVVGDGCKLDDHVHVGHNVRLGRGVVIAAQTGLSGSCVVGDGVLVGGQAGLADHAVVGAGARVGAQSGVHGEIPPGETWLGTPARPIATMRRVYALTADLPQMWRDWRARR